MNPAPRLQDILGEWRTNWRLRLACWSLLVIVAMYALQSLHQRQAVVAAEYEQLAGQAVRLQALVGQDFWSEQAVTLSARRDQLQSRLQVAESRGMDQATLQSHLNVMLKQHGLDNARVQVEQPLPLAGDKDIMVVVATIDVPYEFRQLLALLNALETGQQLVVVERLEFASQGRPRCLLGLKAYFLVRS